MAETPVDLSLEEIKARERMVAEDVAKRNADVVTEEPLHVPDGSEIVTSTDADTVRT